jgi:hypothetical protein
MQNVTVKTDVPEIVMIQKLKWVLAMLSEAG